MRILTAGLLSLLFMMMISSCRERVGEEVTMFDDDGVIFTEMFFVGEHESRFWKIRELEGRGTLLVQQGVLGGESSSYEVFENDRNELRKRAQELAAEKLKAGYRVFGPEAYSKLVVQVNADEWGEIGDIDQLVLVEELLNDYMRRSGNGNCYGSDVDENHVRFFIAAFNADVAVGTILNMFSEEGMTMEIIVFKEDGNDIKVLFPIGFQGDITLI